MHQMARALDRSSGADSAPRPITCLLELPAVEAAVQHVHLAALATAALRPRQFRGEDMSAQAQMCTVGMADI